MVLASASTNDNTAIAELAQLPAQLADKVMEVAVASYRGVRHVLLRFKIRRIFPKIQNFNQDSKISIRIWNPMKYFEIYVPVVQ